MHPNKIPSSMREIQLEPGSFRDRNGRVYYRGQDVYRTLSADALEDWRVFSKTNFFSHALAAGKLIHSEIVTDQDHSTPDNAAAVLKHEPVSFISYPYEWCFGMLKDAALLQLELLSAALKENVILKDSSPYNIQWRGTEPVFIDILSFTKLKKGQIWTGYLQFCELFLYPLLIQAYKEIPFHSLLRGSLDGIPPEVCNNLFPFWDRLRPGVFKHVYLHSKLQNSYSNTNGNLQHDLKSAGFAKELIEANIRGLNKLVEKLQWRRSKSGWSHYTDDRSYSAIDLEQKQAFVRKSVDSNRWKLCWDLGCNTGEYSRIASSNSDYVVALDADHFATETFYRQLRGERNRKILPLVLNLTDGSPNLGWRGKERKDLASRGKPDLVLCLALIHHIVIHGNVPMDEFVDWLASLEASLIIEFIHREDPMVQKLLKNKSDQYFDYDPQNFQNCLSKYFHLIDSKTLESRTRTLYFASPLRVP